ncbi:putative lipoprotein YqgU [Bacillus velezensis]|nr:putative lipoprotein YqgU [Bacillus velezensis]
MNKQGKRLYHKAFNSYELETAWNPYDPYQMMITVFTETWDFTAYTADMNNGILKRVPFRPLLSIGPPLMNSNISSKGKRRKRVLYILMTCRQKKKKSASSRHLGRFPPGHDDCRQTNGSIGRRRRVPFPKAGIRDTPISSPRKV